MEWKITKFILKLSDHEKTVVEFITSHRSEQEITMKVHRNYIQI